MSDFKVISQDEIVPTIKCRAESYEMNLSNKMLLFVFKDRTNSLGFIQTIFQPANFMHLTGVTSNIRPYTFYDRVLNNRLTLNKAETKHLYLISKKLSALDRLTKIDKIPSYIGKYEDKLNIMPNLKTDTIIGYSFDCLGFVKTSLFNGYYAPQTALKVNIDKITMNLVPTVAVFKKTAIINNSLNLNPYSELTFLDDTVSLSEILNDNNISQLVSLSETHSCSHKVSINNFDTIQNESNNNITNDENNSEDDIDI